MRLGQVYASKTTTEEHRQGARTRRLCLARLYLELLTKDSLLRLQTQSAPDDMTPALQAVLCFTVPAS
jgi:hypothetical protein